MSLTKDEILSGPKVWPVHEVEVPEWGDEGKVYVRECPGTVYAQVQASLQKVSQESPQEDTAPDFGLVLRGFAELCVLFVCDEQGEPLFTEDNIGALCELPNPLGPLKRCAEAGLACNSFTGKDDLEKNSGSVSTEDSPSTSLQT